MRLVPGREADKGEITMKKMTGIKEAAGDTKMLNGYNGHVQVNLDTKTGKVWTSYETDDSWRTEYHERTIVSIFYRRPATMEEIKKDLEVEIVSQNKRYENLL